MTKDPDKSVFFDESGARWKLTKGFLLILLASFTYLGFWVLPKVTSYALTQPEAQNTDLDAATHSNINQVLNHLLTTKDTSGLPVIGRGPFVRMAYVLKSAKSYSLIDPFTFKNLRQLSPAEAKNLSPESLVLDQYGKSGHKTLALTFDDGPDVHFTTGILDLLAEEGVTASFFVLGTNTVKYPDVARRIVEEGHLIANHSLTHRNMEHLNKSLSAQEINLTSRIIREVAQVQTPYFRIPYMGNDPESLREVIMPIITAQKMGYTLASYTLDSKDWRFTPETEVSVPRLSGSDDVMLLHDGGNNRQKTIDYTRQLIRDAKSEGYTFVTIDEQFTDTQNLVATAAIEPDFSDKATVFIVGTLFVWPGNFIKDIGAYGLVLIYIPLLIKILLAWRYFRLKSKEPKKRPRYRGLVSVVIPAFNEEAVLGATITSVLRSRHKKMEIIVCDDGSSDATGRIADLFAQKDRRIRVIHTKNRGKAHALNTCLDLARSDVIISLDADTIFDKNTVTELARHFIHANTGAVAGVVRVGNERNALSRWQALEYITGIFIERSAQAYLQAIFIVPGACSAWRKSAVLSAGGFSRATMAEDCDLTLSLHRLGYSVFQEPKALSKTEVPETVQTFLKQRFRWMFGNLQAIWKHKSIAGNPRFGWLGVFVMPTVFAGLAAPLILVPFLIYVTLENFLSGYAHLLVIYGGLAMALQFILAAAAVSIAKEHRRHILSAPLARFLYQPLRNYLLLHVFLSAIRGAQVNWNKLIRNGSVQIGNN